MNLMNQTTFYIMLEKILRSKHPSPIYFVNMKSIKILWSKLNIFVIF